MPISSNTLFHFTSSRANLVSILLHEFRPSLSLENFEHIRQHLAGMPWMSECAFPMVCFCDIPLSQVASHMAHYGDYGIGLSKGWGMRNGIAPVLYTHPQSRSALSMAQLAALTMNLHVHAPATPLAALSMSSGSMVYHVKPYEGILERRDRKPIPVRFYDEREWRYVPAEVESIPAVSREMWEDKVQRLEADTKVAALAPLPFEPNDIRYIVVAHDAEVDGIIEDVRQVKGRYDSKTIDRLVSRIVSAERIRDDF